MQHSKAIAKIEEAIKEPLIIYSARSEGIISHDNPQIKHAGRVLPTGDYAMVQMQVMVPLAALDAAQA